MEDSGNDVRFVRREAGDLVTLFLYLYEFVYEVYDFAYDNPATPRQSDSRPCISLHFS